MTLILLRFRDSSSSMPFGNAATAVTFQGKSRRAHAPGRRNEISNWRRRPQLFRLAVYSRFGRHGAARIHTLVARDSSASTGSAAAWSGLSPSPLLFWVVHRLRLRESSFRSGGAPGRQHYLDYFFPGALIMIVLFTTIFTMMSVIEDRKEGLPALRAGRPGEPLGDRAWERSWAARHWRRFRA